MPPALGSVAPDAVPAQPSAVLRDRVPLRFLGIVPVPPSDAASPRGAAVRPGGAASVGPDLG